MTEKKITCITCPVGCEITVSVEDGNVKSVEGNKCPRGAAYASTEAVHPVRILTSTASIAGSGKKRIAVRTSAPIPKEMLFDCMKKISSLSLRTPVKMGQILIPSVCETGVDVISSETAE